MVSNNNSAIKNVQEKLAQYKLDFLSAMLGKDENKIAFIESQKPRKLELPIEQDRLALWSWQSNISKKVVAAKKLFNEQNELARVNAEFENAKVNYEHFKEYLVELGVFNYALENRNDLNRFDIESIRNRVEVKLKKSPAKTRLSFLTRFWLRFIKGLFNWKFLKGDSSAIIASLENFCFVSRLAEYGSRIRSLSNAVKTDENASADLIKLSKAILYENVFRKFNLRKDQVFYTKDDLYYKWGEFLKDYPIVFSTTFASKSAINSNAVFDYVIMDESSQVDIATGALALSCARRWGKTRIAIQSVLRATKSKKATVILYPQRNGHINEIWKRPTDWKQSLDSQFFFLSNWTPLDEKDGAKEFSFKRKNGDDWIDDDSVASRPTISVHLVRRRE